MTDLSDFGGGVNRDDPNPEDDINQELSSWLRGNDRTVYWDRKKTYGNGTFEISTQRRPDLVIDAKSQTYAVEVKRAEDSGKVHDGVIQTYNYWRDLVGGNAEYTARGKGLDIDAVLLATEHAPKGRLFHDWQKKDPKRSGRSNGAQRAADAGHIPDIEHTASETAVRLMYRFGKEYEKKATIGIGALLSSALDGDDPHPDAADPAALFYAPGGTPGDGGGVQNWEYVPWFLNE